MYTTLMIATNRTCRSTAIMNQGELRTQARRSNGVAGAALFSAAGNSVACFGRSSSMAGQSAKGRARRCSALAAGGGGPARSPRLARRGGRPGCIEQGVHRSQRGFYTYPEGQATYNLFSRCARPDVLAEAGTVLGKGRPRGLAARERAVERDRRGRSSRREAHRDSGRRPRARAAKARYISEREARSRRASRAAESIAVRRAPPAVPVYDGAHDERAK